MAYYEVTKTMQYTVTCYIEAESVSEANDKSGHEEGEVNQDDTWHDSSAREISLEEYEEATKIWLGLVCGKCPQYIGRCGENGLKCSDEGGG